MTAGGLGFLFLGVLLFFDKALLAMGNVMFLMGLTLIIGVRKISSFFLQRKKVKGTVCFFLGLAIVLYGWPVVGMAIEAFGFANLFGDFFPVALAFITKIPVVGPVLCGIPGVSGLMARVAPGGVPKMPV